MAHQKRIARGARWFDKHDPGWEDRINLRTLDPDSVYNCAMGQVRGDFGTFMDSRYRTSWLSGLGDHEILQLVAAYAFPGTWLGVRFAASHGFIVIRETYSQWRQAWMHEVTIRRDRKRKELHNKIDREHHDVLLDDKLYVPVEWQEKHPANV